MKQLCILLVILSQRISPMAKGSGSVGPKQEDFIVVASQPPFLDQAMLKLMTTASNRVKLDLGFQIRLHHGFDVWECP